MDGKSVLITGGSGTFGRAFCRWLLDNHKPRRIIVFSRDEMKQYEMRFDFPEPQMRFWLGDVRDPERVLMAFRGVDIVIHAAALKHVPSGESNPIEVIKTNVIGAQNVITAAIEAGVTKVVALSTDKACAPLNLYGASKFCAEKLFVASNQLSGEGGTRFSVVRYGNVAGSRGSVIPLFKKLAETGRIPITDPAMTRFFMTVEQAVEFVASSLKLMRGGETFVPYIPAINILKLARHIGGGDACEYPVIGIRSGEKIHETLIAPEEVKNVVALLSTGYVILPDHEWFDKSDAPPNHGPARCGFTHNSKDARPMTPAELEEACNA